jgi:ABC-2 type transport system permease protein
MIALVRGELIKVRTTRTALGFAVTILGLTLLWVLLSFLTGDPISLEDKRTAINVAPLPLAIPLLLFGVVGATGEYRHRTLAPAVLIAPDRTRLTIARLVAYVLTALAIAVIIVALTLLIALALLPSTSGPDLGGDDFRRMIVGTLIASVLSVALGVGVGLLVKNQVAAVIGTLVWIMIGVQLIQLIDDDLPNYTTPPATVALGGSLDNEVSWSQGLIVMLAWTAVFLILGLLADRRRDVD